MRSSISRAAALFVFLGGSGCHESSVGPARPVDPPSAIAPVGANAAAAPSAGSVPLAKAERADGGTYAKPPVAELRQRLTPIQFEVTQNEATEPPFHNDFWDNHAPGIYVDVATGEPLFSSLDKFESGTGWPSFTRPIEDGHVVAITDTTFGMSRTEVRSSGGSSHLGHVFDDGPPPTRQRYCINSASLRFIPVDRLAAEGYGAYAPRFGGDLASVPVPASTANSCAAPAPGEHPGCEATLDTAVLGGGRKTRAQLQSLPGVLEVEPGAVGQAKALRIIFDPKQIAYGDLLGKWAPIEATDGPGSSVVYVTSEDQRRAAQEWSTRALPATAPGVRVAVRHVGPNAFTHVNP